MLLGRKILRGCFDVETPPQYFVYFLSQTPRVRLSQRGFESSMLRQQS